MAGEDPEHIRRVKQLPCCMREAGGCIGGVEAHHVTYDRALGKRQHDHLAIPLCFGHHLDFHKASGPFRGWLKEARRVWQAARVEETVARLQRCVPPVVVPW